MPNKHKLENSRGKRTVVQRQMDLHRLSQLLFTGNYTNQEMTAIINEGRPEEQHVSPSTISLDIKKLKQDWAEKRRDNLDFLVNREVARLDHLEAKLWEALNERSVKKVTRTRKTLGDSITETQEDLPPNPAIFAQILSVQKERRRMLGLYAPSLSLITNVELKGYSVVSPDDWPDDVVEGQYKLKDRN